MLVFSIAPRQTGQVGLANPLMRFSGLQLEIPLRSREDSPAVDSESLRGCPWRKKPNCWRAATPIGSLPLDQRKRLHAVVTYQVLPKLQIGAELFHQPPTRAARPQHQALVSAGAMT